MKDPGDDSGYTPSEDHPREILDRDNKLYRVYSDNGLKETAYHVVDFAGFYPIWPIVEFLMAPTGASKDERMASFTRCITVLLGKMLYVDDTMVIAPIDTNDDDDKHFIKTKADFPSNFAKFGKHIMISGGSWVFNKKDKGSNDVNGRFRLKSQIPTEDMVNRVSFEFSRVGGKNLFKKQHQAMETETPVMLLFICNGSICFGETVGYIRKTGKDKEGLGRWCWILLDGNNGHQTRIVTAYNPCKNKAVNSGTTYQQQRWYYITKRKDLSCPRKIFRRDLIKQLKSWQEAGDRIILFMDHNDATNGPLGKELVSDKNGLDLREAIIQHTGASPGATFFRGSKPLDGMWVSEDLDISNACVMLFGYGVGDHRTFVLNIPLESMIGIDPVKIVRPVGRRLNSKLPGCCKTYIASLESNIAQHRLLNVFTMRIRARILMMSEHGRLS